MHWRHSSEPPSWCSWSRPCDEAFENHSVDLLARVLPTTRAIITSVALRDWAFFLVFACESTFLACRRLFAWALTFEFLSFSFYYQSKAKKASSFAVFATTQLLWVRFIFFLLAHFLELLLKLVWRRSKVWPIAPHFNFLTAPYSYYLSDRNSKIPLKLDDPNASPTYYCPRASVLRTPDPTWSLLPQQSVPNS